MPISYKHKIYTTLGTPTALSGNVVSATDSAGVPTKDYSVKGKSIVWNQLIRNGNFVGKAGWSTSNGTGSVSNNKYTLTAAGTNTYSSITQHMSKSLFIVGHKYYITATITPQYSAGRLTVVLHNRANQQLEAWTAPASSGTTNFVSTIFTPSSKFVSDAANPVNFILYCPQTESAQGDVTVISNVWMTDLTKMFGAGNEPATPEEFRTMFPDDYYPYNVGELKTIVPTSVEASGIERFQLLDKSKYPVTTTIGGVTFTNNGDGTITVNGTARPSDHIYYGLHNAMEVPVGHKILISGGVTGAGWSSYLLYDASDATYGIDSPGGGKIYTVQTNQVNPYIFVAKSYTVSNITFKPQLFDLTKMFGAGNEPATPAEFWQKVPEKLYGYNPNAYKRVNIPSSKYFPDGMRSAGSAYDEINFLSQKAIKRIGVVDMGTLDWGSNPGTYPTNSFYSIDFHDAKGGTRNIISNGKFNNIYANNGGTIIAITDSDEKYDSSEAFKAAMSGVMLYYELATPVETTITPPLQALPTYKGFISFSAPNSLMQNGPLSVTYYAEGGANPESGWLTSYKRKLYMGRTIEWNQLMDKSKYPKTATTNGVTFTNNGDGSITVNGTADSTANIWHRLNANVEIPIGHKVLISGGVTGAGWSSYLFYDDSDATYGIDSPGGGKIYTVKTSPVKPMLFVGKGVACSNLIFKPQIFDLTQMFGAGNEPATPEEFWSYFDHKLYPYNPGETQPLFKISRKSLWAVAPKHYTARWDKIHAAMVRLNDAASFPTNITNFAHRGSVNANYSNPFDNIYPWSGIKLCNISIDLYRNLAAGDSITKCVTAWEGDANFSYNDTNGVWRYRPEFWGKSWEDDTYRYFDVADNKVYDSSYVYYPEAIVGRWHGRNETLTVGGKNQICLVPSVGMPAKRVPVRNLQIYARRYGATLDSIFSIDADVLLCIVEFATMNTQNAIGNGVVSMYRQSSDRIAEGTTNSNVVKVLASAASGFCIPGAIFDIGTSNGGAEVGSYYIVSAQPNAGDAQYLDVTLNEAVTVTAANYWSVHGIINVADEEIGSKSGYIGTNGKCNSYYRGLVLFGNMWLYTLGAYENKEDHHIWIANSDEEADKYVALNTSVHYDTGLVLPTVAGYPKKLGMLSRSGLLSIPVFCTEIGGDSNNPTGDRFYNGVYTYNTVLFRGGRAEYDLSNGALCGYWGLTASASDWSCAARPRLKNP